MILETYHYYCFNVLSPTTLPVEIKIAHDLQRSRSKKNRWFRRHFRWDGSYLSYHHTHEATSAQKWRVHISEIERIVMLGQTVPADPAKAADPSTNRLSASTIVCLPHTRFGDGDSPVYMFAIRLKSDGGSLEVASRRKERIDEWVSVLSRGLYAGWLAGIEGTGGLEVQGSAIKRMRPRTKAGDGKGSGTSSRAASRAGSSGRLTPEPISDAQPEMPFDVDALAEQIANLDNWAEDPRRILRRSGGIDSTGVRSGDTSPAEFTMSIESLAELSHQATGTLDRSPSVGFRDRTSSLPGSPTPSRLQFERVVGLRNQEGSSHRRNLSATGSLDSLNWSEDGKRLSGASSRPPATPLPELPSKAGSSRDSVNSLRKSNPPMTPLPLAPGDGEQDRRAASSPRGSLSRGRLPSTEAPKHTIPLSDSDSLPRGSSMKRFPSADRLSSLLDKLAKSQDMSPEAFSSAASTTSSSSRPPSNVSVAPLYQPPPSTLQPGTSVLPTPANLPPLPTDTTTTTSYSPSNPSFDLCHTLLCTTRTLLSQSLTSPTNPTPPTKDIIPDQIISVVKYALSIHTYLTREEDDEWEARVSSSSDHITTTNSESTSSQNARTKAKRKALDEFRTASEDLARRTRDYVAVLASLEGSGEGGGRKGRPISQHSVVVDVMEATDVLLMRLAQIRQLFDGVGVKE
ncbi:hypothetical protein HDV00_001280 [Rhizophlyctis rosea]|nr:hypothetical protein HDV00_001280 [Rhizophlyctis rosea]